MGESILLLLLLVIRLGDSTSRCQRGAELQLEVASAYTLPRKNYHLW